MTYQTDAPLTHMERAAQLWCLPQHSHKEMDAALAESIAATFEAVESAAVLRLQGELAEARVQMAALRCSLAEVALLRSRNLGLRDALIRAREALWEAHRDAEVVRVNAALADASEPTTGAGENDAASVQPPRGAREQATTGVGLVPLPNGAGYAQGPTVSQAATPALYTEHDLRAVAAYTLHAAPRDWSADRIVSMLLAQRTGGRMSRTKAQRGPNRADLEAALCWYAALILLGANITRKDQGRRADCLRLCELSKLDGQLPASRPAERRAAGREVTWGRCALCGRCACQCACQRGEKAGENDAASGVEPSPVAQPRLGQAVTATPAPSFSADDLRAVAIKAIQSAFAAAFRPQSDMAPIESVASGVVNKFLAQRTGGG